MTDTAQPLPYASPTAPAKTFSPIVAAGVLIGAGIGLIGLGGCFLIGVMIITMRLDFVALNTTTKPPMTPGEIGLTAILYLLAAACFAGAVMILVPAVLRLLRVLGNR